VPNAVICKNRKEEREEEDEENISVELSSNGISEISIYSTTIQYRVAQ
jgi:hypothetical protein